MQFLLFCQNNYDINRTLVKLHLKERNGMNKTDLIEKIAAETSLTKVQAKSALHALLEAVTDELKRGESVTLIGFGAFQVKKRAARPGRNPQTGETIKIAASNAVVFKAGAEFKNALNGV